MVQGILSRNHYVDDQNKPSLLNYVHIHKIKHYKTNTSYRVFPSYVQWPVNFIFDVYAIIDGIIEHRTRV